MPTKNLKSIFSELVDLRKQKKNKTDKSTHRFLNIAAYNTCENFQGKIVNPTLDRAPESHKQKTLFFNAESV